MRFALFAPSGKSRNHEICAFCTKWQKRPSYESRDLHFLHQVAKVRDLRFFASSGKSGKSMGFALFAPSGKSMNHEICAFCTKWQKYESWDLHFCTQRQKWQKYERQKYESWDLHFLHQVAKEAKVRFALFAPSCKSMNHGICTFCTKLQKRQK